MEIDKALALIFITVLATIGIYGCFSMVSVARSLDEQNKILKELVVTMQEQNAILKYNPMEEEK